MKIRKDFVSNSSSCSFIVHLKTDNDVKAMKEIYDKVDASFSSSRNPDGWYFEDTIGRADEFEKGTLVRVDTGEDHDNWYYERYEKVLNAFRDAYKFRIYADPDAHCTVGESLPHNIEL